MFLWIFLTLAIVFVSLMLYVILSGIFDIYSFLSLMIPFVGYLASYIVMKIFANKDAEAASNKRTLPYCFEKANELLVSMPDGGDVLEWWGGRGRTSIVRSYETNSGDTKAFRAFYGILKNGRQPVLIIWNIDDEDIARYEAPVPAELLTDPFKNFIPFKKEQEYYDRYNRTRTGVRIPIRRNINFPNNSWVKSLDEPQDPFEKQQ